MIVRTIDLHVKPERVQDFIQATLANHRGSVREPGVLRFDVLQDEADPGHFVLYEAFRDAAAAEAHRETAHYKAWAPAVEPMQSSPRQRTVFRPLAPTAEADW